MYTAEAITVTLCGRLEQDDQVVDRSTHSTCRVPLCRVVEGVIRALLVRVSVLTGYLTVDRWFGRTLARRITGLVGVLR